MIDPTATIDGCGVVADGRSIMALAQATGIDIPHVCWHPDLPVEGGCRVCLVEVDGASRPVAACHTPLRPGMAVRTHSPEIDALRRDILALEQTHRDALGPVEVDSSHPYMRFDASICVTCRRCLHACEEVQGQFVYGIEGRGSQARLIASAGGSFADGDCVACGACVDVCPTEAISDRDRVGAAVSAGTVRSTCGYCGVGCQVDIAVDGGRVTRIDAAKDAPVNRGHLCQKGRYAHAWHHSTARLARPLLRDGTEFREVSWDEAVAFAARRLGEVRDLHGPDALGAMTSSRSTNEACYLLQKLFRVVVGTNNVDCCARVCHASTAAALRIATGTGASTASYEDIELARAIVVAGANATAAHPVIGARIRQAVLHGAKLVVIDPRRTELADIADVHLAVRPGANVALLNALARLLLDAGGVDRDYVDERTEGYTELVTFLKGMSLDGAIAAAGVDGDAVRKTARILEDGPTLFVSGLGLSELTQGVGSVLALTNLGMLTGSIGRPGAGMLPLRGQNNVQGSVDMGSAPDTATGYQPVADAAVRAHLATVWGDEPPARAGLTVTEMTRAAGRGELRGLWIMGEDIAQSDPDQDAVVDALDRLDLLIVQEMFMTETARRAHLVFPAAGWLEQDGTFTNAERRIQRVRPAVAPPGEARPDWVAVCDVALGMGAEWQYESPAQVMDEVARAAPALFGGVSHARLEPDGLQWPCPSPDHPGTRRVHADGFVRGRGRLSVVVPEASPEHDVAGFPYTLITGRILEHYNVGTMTRRTPSAELVDADLLEMNPADAAEAGIADGGEVAVESRWGRVDVTAHHTDRVPPGTLFLSFHFPESHTNRLVGPHTDPVSKCPDYKVTAVRLTPGGR